MAQQRQGYGNMNHNSKRSNQNTANKLNALDQVIMSRLLFKNIPAGPISQPLNSGPVPPPPINQPGMPINYNPHKTGPLGHTGPMGQTGPIGNPPRPDNPALLNMFNTEPLPSN